MKTTRNDAGCVEDKSFEHFSFGPLDRADADSLHAGNVSASRSMDTLLSAVKWTFLFLPGAVALHLLMMGFSLFFMYDDWSVDLLLGTVGIFLVSVFMIMFGLGKMTDLRYLRVIAAMVAAGALASITYSLLIVFIPGDFFSRFLWCSLPFTLLTGLLIKRSMDTRDAS